MLLFVIPRDIAERRQERGAPGTLVGGAFRVGVFDPSKTSAVSDEDREQLKLRRSGLDHATRPAQLVSRRVHFDSLFIKAAATCPSG
jgi:hypothetical protein